MCRRGSSAYVASVSCHSAQALWVRETPPSQHSKAVRCGWNPPYRPGHDPSCHLLALWTWLCHLTLLLLFSFAPHPSLGAALLQASPSVTMRPSLWLQKSWNVFLPSAPWSTSSSPPGPTSSGCLASCVCGQLFTTLIWGRTEGVRVRSWGWEGEGRIGPHGDQPQGMCSIWQRVNHRTSLVV